MHIPDVVLTTRKQLPDHGPQVSYVHQASLEHCGDEDTNNEKEAAAHDTKTDASSKVRYCGLSRRSWAIALALFLTLLAAGLGVGLGLGINKAFEYCLFQSFGTDRWL